MRREISWFVSSSRQRAASRAGRAQVGLLARRVAGKNARDRTQYGRARGSTRIFYLHHTRMITKAAVVRDATMIREQVHASACASESAPRTRELAACPKAGRSLPCEEVRP